MKDVLVPRGFEVKIGRTADLMWRLGIQLSNMLIRHMSARPLFLPLMCSEGTYETVEFGLGRSLFRWVDPKGRRYLLRPEGTVLACMLMQRQHLLKGRWFYFDSMYRYERPQFGRGREFHQFGYESFFKMTDRLAVPNSILTILLLKHYLSHFCGKDVLIKFNYIGYRQNFQAKIDAEAMRLNMDTNLLRRELDGGVRRMNFNLTDMSPEERLDLIMHLRWMGVLGLTVRYDVTLVRGLHYYSRVVFECEMSRDRPSIAGGGYYELDFAGGRNRSFCGFGFGVGVDRLVTFMLDV